MKRWHRKGDASVNTEAMNSLTDDLKRLYKPKEGPSYMNRRFAESLRQCSLVRPKRWLSSRRVASPRRLALAAVFIGAIALTATAVALLIPGGSNSPSIAEAQAFLMQMPDHLDVQPGQVLHTKTEVYERYGPKAQIIGERTGIPTENHIRENWIQIGVGDTVSRSLGTLVDANGTVVQKTGFDGASWYSVDPRTGTVHPTAGAPPPKVNVPSARARDLQQALASGMSKVVSQSDSQIVVETTEPIPAKLAQEKADQNDYDVPYAADLHPKTILSRETVGKDGVTLNYEVYVITDSGKQVLIQSEKTVIDEVIDSLPTP